MRNDDKKNPFYKNGVYSSGFDVVDKLQKLIQSLRYNKRSVSALDITQYIPQSVSEICLKRKNDIFQRVISDVSIHPHYYMNKSHIQFFNMLKRDSGAHKIYSTA